MQQERPRPALGSAWPLQEKQQEGGQGQGLCGGQSFLGSGSCVMKGEGLSSARSLESSLWWWTPGLAVLDHALDMWGEGQDEAIPADALYINSASVGKSICLRTVCSIYHEQKNQEKTYSSEV